MEHSAFEHVGQQIDDTTHKAARAASAVADALEDGVTTAQRAVRDGCAGRLGRHICYALLP